MAKSDITGNFSIVRGKKIVTTWIASRLSLASVVVGCAAVPLLAVPSIIGVNGLKPVSSLPEQSRIRRASSGVGRLEFVADDGLVFTCTAALISPVYVLTVA